MTLLTILEFPDPRLRTKAVPVTRFDAALARLAKDMLETMYAAPGIGLAASQVDQHIQMLVLDVSEEKNAPMVIINPRIVASEGRETCQEGCLSVPGIFADVERAERIRIEAQDLDGKTFELEADGLLATCLQHEIDHLNGVLFIDHLSKLKRDRVIKKYTKLAKQTAG